MRAITPITALFLGALALTACSKDEEVDDTAGGDDTQVEEDGESPVLSEPKATCIEHPDAQSSVDLWSFFVRFDDPQGTSDVPRNLFSEPDVDDQHHVEWWRDGNMIDQAGVIACNPDNGTCQGSFPGATYGITCASATDWTFHFVIKDYDGNEGRAQAVGEDITPPEE